METVVNRFRVPDTDGATHTQMALENGPYSIKKPRSAICSMLLLGNAKVRPDVVGHACNPSVQTKTGGLF